MYVGVWTFESEYCRAKHQNWMHPSLVRDDLEMKGHAFISVPHRKGIGGTRKRPLFTSSLEPTQILAFFSAMLMFYFFFSSLYSLLTSALPRGYVSTRQTDTQAEMNMSIFIQTNMRTLKCTDATDGLWHKASR